MNNTQDTILGNIVLYRTSTERNHVDISPQMKCLPLEKRLNLLCLHRDQLEKDINNYDNPGYIKINSVKPNGTAHDPSREMLETHLEITNRFIEKLKTGLFNA